MYNLLFDTESPSDNLPEYCQCGWCSTTVSAIKTCCKTKPCVSTNGNFIKAISATNIEIGMILNKSRSNVSKEELCNCAFRAHAYGAYGNWKLSKGVNVDVPTNCVMSMIQSKYPQETELDSDHECHSDTEVTALQDGNLSD